MSLSQALGIEVNEIVTVVGAGGKSSILMSLGREWIENRRPFLLTTTTKMFYEQVEGLAPVFCQSYKRAIPKLLQNLESKDYTSWFRGWYGTKVLGVEPGWIDQFYTEHRDSVANIIVEGDGAGRRLLKVPGPEEPVVPGLCHRLVGVLNLQAVGKELAPGIIHRFESAVPILGRKEGAILPRDLAALALHPGGIFKNHSAKKVLVLSGLDGEKTGMAAELAEGIVNSNGTIQTCVVTSGFNDRMEPVLIFKKKGVV